jgi:hypothetical protein
MKFEDEKIPKEKMDVIKNICDEITPEISPMLKSVMIVRDYILNQGNEEIDKLMLEYGIENCESFGDRLIHITMEGEEIKAELDTENNNTWVIYHVNDVDKKTKIDSFVRDICEGENRCISELIKGFEVMGLVFNQCFAGQLLMEYQGHKAYGYVLIPLLVSKEVTFKFVARL